jgi:hypothetical protein
MEMSVNWIRIYNRLFEIINSSGNTYFSGSRFISKIREADPYFHSYSQYIEERRQTRKSTSRRDYFYDILLEFDESKRLQILQSILDDVRDSVPDKVSAIETELEETLTINPVQTTRKNDAGINTSVDTSEHSDPPTHMYHEKLAPTGKIFKASEIPKLEKAGWVDTPARLGETMRSKARGLASSLGQFWLAHWKWIIGTFVPLAALILNFVKG